MQLEQNSYWLTNLKDYVVYGDEDKLSTLRPEFQAAIGALTAESIQADAQQFLRSDRYIQVTLFPEAYAGRGIDKLPSKHKGLAQCTRQALASAY